MGRREKIEYAVISGIIVIGYAVLLAFVFVRVNSWRIREANKYLYEAKRQETGHEKLLLLEKAAFLDPSEGTYLPTGILLLETGQYDLAQHYLSRVKTPEGYYQLGNAYYNLEHYEKAVSVYEKSVEPASDDRTHLSLAKSYLKIGDLADAKSHLKILLEHNAANAEALGLFADISISREETDAPGKVIVAYNDLNNLGYPHAAKSLLDNAQEAGWLNRESYILLANEEISKGEYAVAYDYLQRARSIDPHYPQIYKQLATVCQGLGRIEEAKQYIEYYDKITF